MASRKIIFEFMFLIKFVINVDPSSAVSPAPLTSIRIEKAVMDLGANHGVVIFGEKVTNERQIGHPIDIRVQPDPEEDDDGITVYDSIIKNSLGRRITRVKLQSCLGIHATGERVHEMGFGPNHHSVKIRFWSKPNLGITYTVTLYGP